MIITYHTIIVFKWTKATNRQAKSELKEAKAVLGPQSPLFRTFQFGMIDKQKFYFDHQKIILHMSYWTNWISLLWFPHLKFPRPVAVDNTFDIKLLILFAKMLDLTNRKFKFKRVHIYRQLKLLTTSGKWQLIFFFCNLLLRIYFLLKHVCWLASISNTTQRPQCFPFTQ